MLLRVFIGHRIVCENLAGASHRTIYAEARSAWQPRGNQNVFRQRQKDITVRRPCSVLFCRGRVSERDRQTETLIGGHKVRMSVCQRIKEAPACVISIAVIVVIVIVVVIVICSSSIMPLCSN